jgi:hypothetical protein
MHIFHSWNGWHVIKTELKKDTRYYKEEFPTMAQWYEIHERRVCEKCGKVEYRIRNSG